MPNSEDIKIELDGKTYVGWGKIAKKVNISADLLRARVSRLGWTIEKAINTEVTELGKTGKEIFFKGKKYQTQEDFATELEKDSPFSKTTLKIKLGKLNKVNISDFVYIWKASQQPDISKLIWTFLVST